MHVFCTTFNLGAAQLRVTAMVEKQDHWQSTQANEILCGKQYTPLICYDNVLTILKYKIQC